MIDKELLEQFLEEILDGLINIDFELTKLSQDPHERKQLNHIYSIFHKVKYNCNIIQAHKLRAVSEAAEMLVEQLQLKHNLLEEIPIEMLRRASDAFIFIVRNLLRDGQEGQRDFKNLIQQLEQETKKLKAM